MSLSHDKINIVILLMGVMFVLLCVAVSRAEACEPPSLPEHPKIRVINIKKASNIPLKEEDQALFAEYESDLAAYAALYNKVFPCDAALEGTVQIEEGATSSDEILETLMARMEALEEKWMGKQELKEKLIKERVKYGNGYYEVDLNEGGYNFE